MPFSNPIVAGEELIRSGIKSEDFNMDEESGAFTGWRIARDGTAYFNELVIGNANFNIDENGNAVFQNVSATDITLNGESLNDTLYRLPTGTIAGVALAGTTSPYTGTKIWFGTIAVPNPDPARLYRLKMSNIPFRRSSTSTANRVITVYVYAGLTNPVPATGSEVFRYIETIDDGTAQTPQYVSTDWPLTFGTSTTVYFSFYFGMGASGTTRVDILSGDQPTLYVEDLGLPDSFTALNISSSTPVEGTFTKTYTATDSDSFQSDGDDRNIASCYQGYYSSTNGNQFSMIAFDYATIASDLAGATIDKVELYLNNNHFYAASGGTAVIGTHNQTSIGGNHSSSQLDDDIIRYHYDKGQAKWVTLPNSVGEAFRDGTAKGIGLGPGPTNSTLYYGYFAGASQSGPPQLRITYTK